MGEKQNQPHAAAVRSDGAADRGAAGVPSVPGGIAGNAEEGKVDSRTRRGEVSQEVASGAQFSAPEVPGAPHTGHAEVGGAEKVMLRVDTRGGGVYIPLVPEPKWKFRITQGGNSC